MATYSYLMPAMEHCLNSISFRVSVPVLSEKMYLICPSSSLRFEVRAMAGVSVGA